MQLDYLGILFRWLHMLAALTAVGGMVFMRAALLPAVAKLQDQDRGVLMEAVRSRWTRFVAASILLLLVSGSYNFIITLRRFDVPSQYHMLFGIKFLLALGIFLIASLLTGRSAAAQQIRQNARFWLTLNLVMAIVLVCISGVLRAIPRTPKTAAPTAAAIPWQPSAPDVAVALSLPSLFPLASGNRDGQESEEEDRFAQSASAEAAPATGRGQKTDGRSG